MSFFNIKNSDSFVLELESKGLELAYVEDKSKFDELMNLHTGEFFITPVLYNTGGNKLFFTQQVGTTFVSVLCKTFVRTIKVADFCVRWRSMKC